MHEEKTFDYFLEKANDVVVELDKHGEKLNANALAVFGSYFYSIGYDDCRDEFMRRGL